MACFGRKTVDVVDTPEEEPATMMDMVVNIPENVVATATSMASTVRNAFRSRGVDGRKVGDRKATGVKGTVSRAPSRSPRRSSI